MTELERWSGVPSKLTCRIVYAGGVSEREADLSALRQAHRTDLPRIRQLWIDVEPDVGKWAAQGATAVQLAA
jgi:hypothetical protein